MKIGDLVARPYGEHPRLMAIIVGWRIPSHGRVVEALAQVIWVGGTRMEEIGSKYLEVVSEGR